MKEWEAKKQAKNKKKDTFDTDIQSCSATDCTGLIPSLPQSEAELDSYEALYNYRATEQESTKAR